jgi:hypothetical protein
MVSIKLSSRPSTLETAIQRKNPPMLDSSQARSHIEVSPLAISKVALTTLSDTRPAGSTASMQACSRAGIRASR